MAANSTIDPLSTATAQQRSKVLMLPLSLGKVF